MKWANYFEMEIEDFEKWKEENNVSGSGGDEPNIVYLSTMNDTPEEQAKAMMAVL